jgi:hypothetical protein
MEIRFPNTPELTKIVIKLNCRKHEEEFNKLLQRVGRCTRLDVQQSKEEGKEDVMK